MTLKLLTEIYRINEIIGTKKSIIKESIIDEIIDFMIKFLSKSSDELLILGVKNSDELLTLLKNFPAANVVDQVTILRTVIAGLGEYGTKTLAKTILEESTSSIGKNIIERTNSYVDFYKKGIMTYDDVISQIGIDVNSLLIRTSDELSALKQAINDEAITKAKNSLDNLKDDITTSKVVDNNDPQSYLDNLSKTDLESKLNSISWKEIGYNQDFYSGWKFHVFAEDLKDVVYLQDALKPVIDKYRCTAKVGGINQIENIPSFKPGGLQYGKQGATLYIPPEVINSGRQTEMLADIQNAISGYKKGGTIMGDQSITPAIHYRYELKGPVPSQGVDYESYKVMYDANTGSSYKPLDVDDLFK